MFLYCSDFKAQANEGRTYSIRKISLLGQRKKTMQIKNENEVFQWIVLVRGGRESGNLRPDKMMIINGNEILSFPVLKRETGPLNRHFLSFLTLAWQKKRQKESRFDKRVRNNTESFSIELRTCCQRCILFIDRFFIILFSLVVSKVWKQLASIFSLSFLAG